MTSNVSANLIANSRRNMIDTLSDLACVDRQQHYAASVPYVHVPSELAAQWDQHSSLLHGQPWFYNSLTEQERDAALQFDSCFKTFLESLERNLPNLDELCCDSRWTTIGLEAARALEAFN